MLCVCIQQLLLVTNDEMCDVDLSLTCHNIMELFHGKFPFLESSSSIPARLQSKPSLPREWHDEGRSQLLAEHRQRQVMENVSSCHRDM